MDTLTYVQPPIDLRNEEETLRFSVLTNGDLVSIAGALRQGFYDILDADKTIKAVERAKAKSEYIVSIGDIVNFCIYDPAGQSYALFLSLKKLDKDVTQMMVAEMSIENGKKIEIIQYIMGIPLTPSNAVDDSDDKKKAVGMTTA